MPELPEVQTVVDTLAPLIRGRRMLRLLHLRDDIVSPADIDLRQCVEGRTVCGVVRRGKRIVVTLDDGNRLFIHLGMTGRLTVEPSAADLLPHTHVVAQLDSGTQLRFVDPRRFGGIGWLGTDPSDPIGPEPFAIRPGRLFNLLQRTRRPIKAALLDQRFIAGIGNIYADEALFAAGIHPQRRTDSLSRGETTRLNGAIKRVLRRAIRYRGSSLRDYVDADGLPGGFQRLHKAYDRTGKPCTRCKCVIQRIIVAQRSTHFCPECQPLTG